ncbi:hypothetical protein FQR65_LT06677 [Abscondita terminalis]|nr:hypothetical protein FQR65_LT06677 [Abscondita terminalis]
MWGQKIQQLKEAMIKILEQLKEEDTFNLVEFNSNAKIWDLNNHSASVWYPRSNNWYYSDEPKVETVSLLNGTFPRAYSANADNIKKAKDAINKLNSDGSTDMYSGLEVGLHLIEVERTNKDNTIKRQPIVVFLTDGEPTDYSTDDITTKVSEFNSGPRKAPIFALSFGEGADKNFLKKLSLRNYGFSRHIYEAADASLQLQDFYKQISSPLLSDVTFKYEPTITSLTKTDFPIHFGGSELVVAGWCGTVTPFPSIDGTGRDGLLTLKPVVTKSISNVERLWAYLTISQMLEKKEESKDNEDELKKKALELALKYEFVTPVSSLVVVKPNDTSNHNRVGGGFAGGFFAAPVAFESDSVAFEPLPTMMPVELLTTNVRSTLEALLDSLPWLKDVLSDLYIKAPTDATAIGPKLTCSIMLSSMTTLHLSGSLAYDQTLSFVCQYQHVVFIGLKVKGVSNTKSSRSDSAIKAAS